MGNIPLATVLNGNGVLFAGIMGFIYSDLMVPPLVMINAKYYGWRVALYIAAVMYASIVITALSMHLIFSVLDIVPESSRQISEVARFEMDYTFYLNILFAVVAAIMVWLYRQSQSAKSGGHDHGGGVGPKRIIAITAAVIMVVGIAVSFL